MAGFFRDAGHSSSQTQKEPSVNLEVPSSDTEASSKKRVTRIQLFGRLRKKLNQSTASSPFVASRDSANFGGLLTGAASSDRRPSIAIQTAPLPLKPPIKSIGSKLATTFQASHPQLLKPSQPEPVHPWASMLMTSTSSTSRPASCKSGSSSGSWPRSTTPRPSQSLITISLSPNNLSEYKNLFTRLPPQDSEVTPSSIPPPTRLPKFDSPIYPRRGQTPASAIAAAHRQATSDGDNKSPSRSSRYSRKTLDSDKGHEEIPGLSGARESLWASTDGEKGLPLSLQRHPSPVMRSGQSSELKNINSPSSRSRMKPPSNPIRSGLPLMSLPQTPVSSAPLHDILLPVDQPMPNTTVTLSPPSTDSPAANFDINTASAPQLRAALRTRNQEYDGLATYVLKVTEAHTTEMRKLDKKTLTLENEVARKDKELKGLRWIINNGDLLQPQPLSTGVFKHSLPSPPLLDPEDNSRKISGTSRRLYYQSDSGTESHAESVSFAASGSDSVSSFRHKSLRKPSTFDEVTYNFCHTGSACRPSKMPPGLGVEKVLEMPTSLSRFVSPSPSSSESTSSLLPPSPSVTMSSLSAICEGPPSALRPSLRYDNSDQEKWRALRASHCTSMSSLTSSSTAASSIFSGNIKCSRPPSFAQVLEESPIMDDVLEKLHPFT